MRQRSADRRLPVLCFHGIGAPGRELESGEERFWISESTFGDILDLVTNGPVVQLTFDDSNDSDWSIAMPALLAHELRASFFVLSGRLDQAGSLSRSQVRELHGAGMHIGSHGMDHVPWRTVTTEEQRSREFVWARELLEECTDRPVTQAACPRGSYDRSVLGHLKRLGYERVYTVDGGASKAGAWTRDRYTVTRHDTARSIAAYLENPDGTGRDRRVRQLKGLAKRWR